MTSAVKIFFALLCLSILFVEFTNGWSSCSCSMCRERKCVSFRKTLFKRTSYCERYTTTCGSWWSRRSCSKYRISWKSTVTGYTTGYKNIWVCRPGCSCPIRPGNSESEKFQRMV